MDYKKLKTKDAEAVCETLRAAFGDSLDDNDRVIILDLIELMVNDALPESIRSAINYSVRIEYANLP